MADISDKKLLQADDGYAPQYYNDVTERFEVVTGVGGSMSVQDKGVVEALKRVAEYVTIDSFVGSGTTEKRYGRGAYGVTLVNDGEEDATIEVNGMTVTVKPYEVYDGLFNRFADVAIKGDAYRVLIKGVMS